jgi:hypothetical protein
MFDELHMSFYICVFINLARKCEKIIHEKAVTYYYMHAY